MLSLIFPSFGAFRGLCFLFLAFLGYLLLYLWESFCGGNLNENHSMFFSIGIKHGFSGINIHQVPWEVVETKAEGRGFQHLPRDLAMLMHWKTMFDYYYCIKIKNICYILRYFLHYFVLPFYWCLANAISTDYAHLRAGTTHLVTSAIMWPRYRHIESCIAVHEQRVNCLVNTWLFAG